MFQLIHPSQLANYLKDPLRKNSTLLIAANLASEASGFFFWVLAARFYSAGHVGLAAAVMSAVTLLVVFSRIGFDVGIIRFLPGEKDKPSMINSCFTIVGLFSIVLSLVFIVGLGLWSPALLFLRHDMIPLVIFVLLTVAYSLFLLQQNVFVAFRAAQFAFIQSLIGGLRILLVVLLIGFGVLGIYSSFAAAMCIAFIASNFFILKLHPGYRPVPSIRKGIVSDMIGFSFGNYIGDSFRELPRLILPILILNVSGAEMSAYFFIGWTIASLLFMVPYATNSLLLAEVSFNPEKLRGEVIKATRFIFLVLVPAILLVFFFGDFILLLFGEAYSIKALNLLWILALSSIPVAFNSLYVTIKRVGKEIKPIIYTYAFIALATIGASYPLMMIMGLVGIGVAWLASNTIVMLIVIPMMLKQVKV